MEGLFIFLLFLIRASAYLPVQNDSAPGLHDDNFKLSMGASPDASPDSIFGAADPFADKNAREPWPRNQDHLVLITYCHVNATTKAKFAPALEDALNAWRFKLGDIGFEHGHALIFEEATSDGTDTLFCEHPPGSGDWNTDIVTDAVAILDYTDINRPLYATTGHRPGARPWEHFIRVGSTFGAAALQHEWGHILGMSHEHQRPDRDGVVAIHCEKVRGFKDAWAKAQQTDPTVTKDQLCSSWKTAEAFGCDNCLQFIPGEFDSRKIFGWKEYDVLSIMQYPSWVFEDDTGCLPLLPDNCPMAFYKDPKHKDQGTYTIWDLNRISDGDIAWVKAQYSWDIPHDELKVDKGSDEQQTANATSGQG